MNRIRLWPRQWHGVLAIVLVIPFLIMAVTGLLFSHGGALGLRNTMVNASWLPGYSAPDQSPYLEVRNALALDDGWLLATRAGLVEVHGQQATEILAFQGQDVRNLVATPQGALVVTGKGLWLVRDGEWRLVLKGPVQQASGSASQLVAVLKGRGALVSANGGQDWRPLAVQLAPVLAPLPVPAGAASISVATLAHDLHTGKALLGEGEWVWADVLALALLFLSGSGLYMWGVKRGRARAPVVQMAGR